MVRVLQLANGVFGKKKIPEITNGKGTISVNGLVVVSAVIELILFVVAGIALCFGFSMRMMLITH